ncbi:LysR family transcriptional regulator [Pseudomonas fluorescens]|jgi:LysR family nod box-dependent transcriptional activator|uniref:LysR family transcriptional regulator n=2 Tax=Pseudomonas TaxID=286 RepID=UPI002ACADDE9|nr:LysR family transcriptional regulator [Pseudomonas fluorescens]MDZ5433265.1 LysR family transcriptional regulator [Pseudomonas fluorescens]
MPAIHAKNIKRGTGMRFNRLDLNQLVALDALLREKSVSKAAEHVFLSQSAMSNSLTRLREYFQDELLVPAGRKMVITSLGERLAPEVQSILIRIQAVTQLRENFDIYTSTIEISLIVSDYICSTFMPAVVKAVALEAPHVKIRMTLLNGTYLEKLDRGEVDFLIVPDHFSHKSHPTEPLFEDRFCCVAWNENTELQGKVTFEDYQKLGHVVTQIGDGRTTLFEDWFLEKHGDVRRIEIVCPYFSLLPSLVVGTNRIATVHYQLAHLYRTTFPIAIYDLPVETPVFRELIQYHKSFESDQVSVWFRDLLRRVASTITER